MKKNENTHKEKATCREVCRGCGFCNVANYEERRTHRPDTRLENRGLYGAEAMSYYFYFVPGARQAHK